MAEDQRRHVVKRVSRWINIKKPFTNLHQFERGGGFSRRLDQPPHPHDRLLVFIIVPSNHILLMSSVTYGRGKLLYQKQKPFLTNTGIIWNNTKIRHPPGHPAYNTYLETVFHAYSKILHNHSYNADNTVWFFCFSSGLVRVYESVRSHRSDCCDRRTPLPCSVHVCVQNIGE